MQCCAPFRKMKKNIIVSLFDYSCIMVQPWKDAGYECYVVDILHEQLKQEKGDGIHRIKHDLTQPWLPPFSNEKIRMVFAFPPCDHLALSGRRWFKGKGLRYLSQAISMFATAAEFCEWSKAPYFIENPVSTISTYWRKPDYIFNPCDYSYFHKEDNYTKKTCLWVGGGFIMPPPSKMNRLGNQMKESGEHLFPVRKENSLETKHQGALLKLFLKQTIENTNGKILIIFSQTKTLMEDGNNGKK